MQSKSCHSLSRTCIVCGIEKPLNEIHFQTVRFFAEGYSFYCNACDGESRSQKIVVQPVVAVDLINGGKGPDLKADTPT